MGLKKSKKKGNKIRKAIIGLLTLPINLLSAVFSILVVIGIRGIMKGRKLHIKIESLEKGNKR